jgi:hypothetical protein
MDNLQLRINEQMQEAYELGVRLHLSVDMRKSKPYHCDRCGETYDACGHWFPAKERA